MRQPNFVLINCDDLGYGDIGCYGSELNATPRLDRMASEGMRFTDFYMPASVCTPSRAGMMTGCYPKRVGLHTGFDWGVLLPGDPVGLHPDEITIADLLHDAGYATALIGKWHLGDQEPFLPTSHGFDSYFGLPYSNDHYLGRPREERERHPDRFREHGFPPLPLLRNTRVVETEPDQSGLTARYTDEAVRFIRANHGRPFFLYLAHLYVHTPLFPPAQFVERSRNGAYGAEVECIDWSAGVILDTLAELGIDQSTLVVFTSDNGSTGKLGGSNAPLRGSKATVWEGGFREPCIVRWPGTVPANTICREVTTAMDFLPTFAALGATAAPGDRVIDGHDIAALLRDDHGATSPYGAFYYYGPGQSGLRAVRSGKWKLLLESGELYDLELDIGENANVAESHPEVVADLHELAAACRADLGDGVVDSAGSASGDDSAQSTGANCRPAGRVEKPRLLTWREGLDPRLQAMYD
jgi:arylsulfatase A